MKVKRNEKKLKITVILKVGAQKIDENDSSD
jgi:hypothetical protein